MTYGRANPQDIHNRAADDEEAYTRWWEARKRNLPHAGFDANAAMAMNEQRLAGRQRGPEDEDMDWLLQMYFNKMPYGAIAAYMADRFSGGGGR